jgi:predicted ATPase
MIKNIKIRNFKSLKDLSLELSDLNVVTGMNGVGKSSLIQSLLLLRQSYRANLANEGIVLDGDLTGNLGTVKDVFNVLAESKEIMIGVDDCICNFNIADLGSTIIQGKCDFKKLKHSSLLAEDKFQYISASRISPGYEFRKSTYHIENKQLGRTGEYVVSFLAELGQISSTKKKDQKYASTINLAVDEKNNPLPLESQVNHWLNYVADDVRLNVVKTTNSKYELKYEFYNGSSWESFS